MHQTKRAHIVLGGSLILALWAGLVVALGPAHRVLLDWDEVNYVQAAELGGVANAFDKGSMSPKQFLSFVNSKRAGVAPDPIPGYSESRDPLLLRHYHPPLVIYLVSAFSSGIDKPSERVIRSVQLLGALMLMVAMMLSYSSVTGSPRWLGLLLVSLLAFWISLISFSQLSFHGWAAVWTVTTAALIHRWLETRRAGIGILLCISLALSLLTLETGLLVWSITLLCLLIWRRPAASEQASGVPARQSFPWRYAVAGLVLTSFVVVLAWPGLLLKVSLLKTAALYAYRSGYGYEGRAERLPEMVKSLLPALIMAPLAGAWIVRAHRRESHRWGPFVLVGVIYGITMAPQVITSYLAPAVAPLICVVGFAADRVKSLWVKVLAVSFTVGLIAVALLSSRQISDQDLRDDLRWSSEVFRGREALVDVGDVYRYYLGPEYAIRSVTVSPDGNSLQVRDGLAYRPIQSDEIAGRMIVLRKSQANFFGGEGERNLLRSCSKSEGRTVMVYDCAPLEKEAARAK